MALSRKESMAAVPFSTSMYCPMRPGVPYVPPYAIGVISSATLSVGTNQAVRFPIGRRCVITNVYFDVTTAVTSAAVDLAWYRFNYDNESLTFGGILATNIAAATTGTKTAAVTLPVDAGADLFIGIMGRTAAPTIRRTMSYDFMLDSTTPSIALSAQGFTGYTTSGQGAAISNANLMTVAAPRLAIAAAAM